MKKTGLFGCEYLLIHNFDLIHKRWWFSVRDAEHKLNLLLCLKQDFFDNLGFHLKRESSAILAVDLVGAIESTLFCKPSSDIKTG